MNESDALMLLLETYSAPAVVVGFAVLKGFAAVINNNLSTKGWHPWLRAGLDFLASADKKAKETGNVYVDSVIESGEVVAAKKAGKLVKILKILS
jgi:hypothetical protein